MLQNNPDYTETVGTVKAQQSNFNGQADTKIYNDEQKNRLSNDRPETQLQSDIYNQPMAKTILNDLDNNLSAPRRNREGE